MSLGRSFNGLAQPFVLGDWPIKGQKENRQATNLELVQELGERRKGKDALALPLTADPAAASTEAFRLGAIPVMCLPARDEADAL